MVICTRRVTLFSAIEPNNHLKPLPPKVSLETPRTLKKAISANRGLAELRVGGALVPNQVALLRAILLQEARASSEIENVVTTNDALYRAFSHNPESADPHTREVLRYGDALWTGYKDLSQEKPIRPSLLINLVQIIKATNIGVREGDGCQVINEKTREVIYTPPVGKDRILSMLDALCGYLNDKQDDTDPLIRMAVSHYQFEAIHPFPDGNGRAGRVVNILYLIEAGLLDLPVLYLSWYIVRNKSRYYKLLKAVTEHDEWEEWILYMLEAIEVTAEMTRTMLTRVKSALDDAVQIARDGMRKGYSRELIELVFSQPYTRIALIPEAGIAKRNAASIYLRELEQIGILKAVRYGREKLYYNPALTNALTVASR